MSPANGKSQLDDRIIIAVKRMGENGGYCHNPGIVIIFFTREAIFYIVYYFFPFNSLSAIITAGAGIGREV